MSQNVTFSPLIATLFVACDTSLWELECLQGCEHVSELRQALCSHLLQDPNDSATDVQGLPKQPKCSSGRMSLP